MNEQAAVPSKQSRWRLKRDGQIRRKVTRFAEISNLSDLRYRPALASLARITVLLERSYETLANRESLLNKDGEICSSVDTVRRLIDSQAALLKSVGLMPNSILPDRENREFEAAFERIEAMKQARTDGDDKPLDDAE